MELFAEAVSVVGALLLSLSCGLLVEELVFGGLARLFFRRTGASVPTQQPKARVANAGRAGAGDGGSRV